MKISELNHLENVNESNVVKGGLRVNASSSANATGILPSASTYSSVFMSEDSGYDYYYYNYNSEYGSASSSGFASALAGSASAGSSASGSTEDYYYYY